MPRITRSVSVGAEHVLLASRASDLAAQACVLNHYSGV